MTPALWIVTGTYPATVTLNNGEVRRENRNFKRHVLAISTQDAIHAVAAEVPDCRMWNVTHQGDVDVVSEKARQELQ